MQYYKWQMVHIHSATRWQCWNTNTYMRRYAEVHVSLQEGSRLLSVNFSQGYCFGKSGEVLTMKLRLKAFTSMMRQVSLINWNEYSTSSDQRLLGWKKCFDGITCFCFCLVCLFHQFETAGAQLEKRGVFSCTNQSSATSESKHSHSFLYFQEFSSIESSQIITKLVFSHRLIFNYNLYRSLGFSPWPL